MKKDIQILSDACTRCGKCVTLCPAYVFEYDQKQVVVKDPQHCIDCGHCVAVCEAHAITHSSFSYDQIKPIDFDQLPSPEQVMHLLQARRSNRAVSSRPLDASLLDQISQAALLAPTASNSRNIRTLIIQDPVLIQQIIEVTESVYLKWYKQLTHPLLKPIIKLIRPKDYAMIPSFERLLAKQKAGKEVMLRGMTSLIFFYGPKDARFGFEDANLAYQNASLYATAQGVAHFYTGYVCAADKATHLITRLLPIEGRIYAGMALAHAKYPIPNYIEGR